MLKKIINMSNELSKNLKYFPDYLKFNVFMRNKLIKQGYKQILFDKDHLCYFYDVYLKDDNVIKVLKFYRPYLGNVSHRYNKLKDKIEFEKFKNQMHSLGSYPFLKDHVCRLLEFYPHGGYKSEFIDGHNLHSLRKQIANNSCLIDANTKQEIAAAIDQLIVVSDQFKLNKVPSGDWELKNLIYNPKKKAIINVDLEGFCGSRAKEFNCFEEYIKKDLIGLKNKLTNHPKTQSSS